MTWHESFEYNSGSLIPTDFCPGQPLVKNKHKAKDSASDNRDMCDSVHEEKKNTLRVTKGHMTCVIN